MNWEEKTLENSSGSETKASPESVSCGSRPAERRFAGSSGSGVIIFINFISVLLLSLMLITYRTNWQLFQFPPGLSQGLACVALTMTGVSTIIYIRVLRYRRKFKAIETNLLAICRTDDFEQVLQQMEPFPVGWRMPDFGRGWNNLVGAVDQVRHGWQLKQAENSMGQFLCSYDAQRLLGLLDSLSDGIVLADADGKIILANRACEGKVSRRLSEFIGGSITELFDDPNSKIILEELINYNNHHTNASFEVLVPPCRSTAAGSDKIIEDSEEPNQNPAPFSPENVVRSGGTILWICGHRLAGERENSDILLTLRDITQRKISDAGQEAFIAHVSHEMRSPLTNIRAYAETLLSDMVLDARTQKEAFNVINEETSRLIRLVNDVLDLSSMETGTLTLDKGEVALDRLIRQCVNDVRAAASSKKITLQSNYHPKLPNLQADREKLALVINNILSNAIKYTPETGTIFIETNVDDRYVYIKVTDTGMGVAEKDRDKIFDKFYRVQRQETADIPGSGLGLSTAKEIVALHGGAINVISELNKGTEMEVKLPLTTTGPVLGPAANHSAERE